MKKLPYILIPLIFLGVFVYRAYASSVGPNSPGTMADDASTGTVAWSNPDNAKVSDNVYATSVKAAGTGTLYSHYLKATNLGFSIPSNTIINGILVEIEKSLNGYAVYDNTVSIVKSNGGIGTTNKADTTTNWSLTDTYKSYGSSSDLWGETWAYSDINNSNFGVVLNTKLVGGIDDLASTAQVDHIRITVYYTVSGSPQVQIRSGTMMVRSGQLLIK